jgi:hypothetical protein
MLKQIDHLEELIWEKINSFNSINYLCNSEDLMYKMNTDDVQFKHALDRAISACKSLNISINDNFQKVFSNKEEEISLQWNLTPLACYLIIINLNPSDFLVARAQLMFYYKCFK